MPRTEILFCYLKHIEITITLTVGNQLIVFPSNADRLV